MNLNQLNEQAQKSGHPSHVESARKIFASTESRLKQDEDTR
ncbi:hypothetical protein M565_ctg5P0249 [Vibrio cyclitrophicus FF75]|nr:hypothetical protein M565_ctg5P0249 [Vibrio cyclitrophicus FF75]